MIQKILRKIIFLASDYAVFPDHTIQLKYDRLAKVYSLGNLDFDSLKANYREITKLNERLCFLSNKCGNCLKAYIVLSFDDQHHHTMLNNALAQNADSKFLDLQQTYNQDIEKYVQRCGDRIPQNKYLVIILQKKKIKDSSPMIMMKYIDEYLMMNHFMQDHQSDEVSILDKISILQEINKYVYNTKENITVAISFVKDDQKDQKIIREKIHCTEPDRKSYSSYVIDAEDQLLPFLTSFRAPIFDNNAFCYGNDIQSNNLLMQNPIIQNTLITGIAGSGKTQFVKWEITNIIMKRKNDKVIVFDRFGQYTNFAKQINVDAINTIDSMFDPEEPAWLNQSLTVFNISRLNSHEQNELIINILNYIFEETKNKNTIWIYIEDVFRFQQSAALFEDLLRFLKTAEKNHVCITGTDNWLEDTPEIDMYFNRCKKIVMTKSSIINTIFLAYKLRLPKQYLYDIQNLNVGEGIMWENNIITGFCINPHFLEVDSSMRKE